MPIRTIRVQCDDEQFQEWKKMKGDRTWEQCMVDGLNCKGHKTMNEVKVRREIF